MQQVTRKKPQSVVNNLYGDIDVSKVSAWCFEFGDANDRLVKKLIPRSECYVKAGLQDVDESLFNSNDVRPYHVDVWKAKSSNYSKYGKFKTNYELKESETNSLSDFL